MSPRSRLRHQRGFTITELVIATGLSLTVIGSVMTGYLATYTSSMSTLAATKLSQDMGALMSLMTNELRRAGYSGISSAGPASNPFAQANTTALKVFNNMTANIPQAATGSGSCIVYTYDNDEDGVVGTAELAGFRLTPSGTVEMRTSGNASAPDTCATRYNSWTELTDPNFIVVSALTFDLANSRCLKTRDGIGSSDAAANAEDCYARTPVPGSGDITVETREIRITLAAHLAHDAFVHMRQTRTVRVRNDLVRVR